jgi:hypothetical protein
MSTTKIPEFTADASLFRAGHHHAAQGRGGADSSFVVPQLAKGDGDDDIFFECFALCLCCGIAGNRFCCAGCDVCTVASTIGDFFYA